MAIPTWSVGEVLAAADVNTWFVPLVIIKPGDTARNSTTSMSNDPDIVLALAGSSTYHIKGVIFYSGPSAGSSDFKWTFTIPTGATGQYYGAHQNLSGQFAGAFQSNWTDTDTANTNGVGTIMCLEIQGILVTSGSGNFRLQWAQNTSNATNTYVKAQSFLTAQRIA